MNANAYQEWTQSTAVYPDAGDGTIVAMNYVVMALGGEVGEIQNKFKKVLRGDHGMSDGDLLSPAAYQGVYEEFIGVVYYIARLAEELGLDLETVFEHSFELLEDRKSRGVIHGSGDNR